MLRISCLCLGLTIALSACGGESGPLLGPPATIEVLAGGGQIVAVNSAAGTSPRVRVKDVNGNLLPGIAVRFTVEVGGGTVTPDRVVTGADGVAEATTWIMGPAAGVNTLRAQVENGTVNNTISVTAIVTPPSTVTAVGATNFVAFAGQPLATRPVVEVRDGFGGLKAGALVTFVVTAGGGTVTGATVTSDAFGRASLGGWTLGATPGINTVTASLAGGEFALFTAQGLAAALTALEPVSPTDQAGFLGFQVQVLPRVRVRDALGSAVPNVPVTFALSGPGDASLTGTTGITDAEGIASPQDWKLGPVNPTSTVTATLPSFPGPRAEFRATGSARAFVVDLRFLSKVKASQRDAFVAAAIRWMTIITDDLPEWPTNRPAGDCGSNSPAVTESVDDVIIFATVENIDGQGGILGSAGPCTVRNSTSLPVIGRMRFDDADLLFREGVGQLLPLILHEMGHVLGFGTIWTDLGVIADKGTADPIFVGTNALALWPSLTLGYLGRPVPVENQFGPGTADAHWRESVFNAELMTGFIETPGVTMPLSRMTIASFKDLGYGVNYDASEPFAGSLLARLRELNSVPTRINEVITYPTTSVDRSGVARPLAPR